MNRPTNSGEIPDSADNPEQAGELLRLALAFMGKHGIAPDPTHYSLCYEYFAGRDAALRDALDQALAAGRFTPAAARELYQRHIWDDDKQRLEQVRSELRKLVMEAISGVSQAHNQATRSAASLSAQSEKLQRGPSVDELRLILGEVVHETRTIAHNGQLLKQMLDETRREVDTLRDELERTRQQATMDALTGLKNRRAFETALHEACDECTRQSTALTLLLVDIDRFKDVNDTYGHVVGDKVIRSVGALLSANVKGKDTVARLGGEEFAVLLPETPLASAERVAEGLRHIIEHSRLRRADTGETLGRVTVSIGVTAYQKGESYDNFVERADQALYQSKKSGRNCVSVSPPDRAAG